MNRLIIDLEIYSKKNIETVKELYKNLANIEEKTSGNKISLTFKNCRLDIRRTMKEFENYLIGLENTHADY